MSESDLALTMLSSCVEKHHHTLLAQLPDAPPIMGGLNQAAASLGLPTYPTFEAFRKTAVNRRVSRKTALTNRGVVSHCSKGLIVALTAAGNLAVLSTVNGGLLVSIEDGHKPELFNSWHWPQARIV